MKTCVFITGTNCTGKSSLAKALIAHFGGIERVDELCTYCNDGTTAFGGKYSAEKTFGGIDGFNETKCLAKVVERGFESRNLIFCEGMYLHTFGLNLTNAMFKADRHLLVFLYAPVAVINQRLVERAGKGITNKAVISKQHAAAAAARKWQSIGVPVLAIDTDSIDIEGEVRLILKKINEVCGT